jgi:hypothetical protein
MVFSRSLGHLSRQFNYLNCMQRCNTAADHLRAMHFWLFFALKSQWLIKAIFHTVVFTQSSIRIVWLCWNDSALLTYLNPDDWIANPDYWIANPDYWIANPDYWIANPDYWIANPDDWIANSEDWDDCIANPDDWGDWIANLDDWDDCIANLGRLNCKSGRLGRLHCESGRLLIRTTFFSRRTTL